MGFVPFVVMWGVGHPLVEIELPATLPELQVSILSFIVCSILADITHYWVHRLLHVVPFLRHNVHYIHHQYEGTLYAWVVMQVHPLEAVLINVSLYWPFVLFAHPIVTWIFAIVGPLYSTIIHSGWTSSINAVDHQIHHELNSTRNFGNMFRLWDQLFGTYRTK
jgi:sterol desaturase/sphingolipid hydroxylase (fatty acid hydroxylase superfamily)